MAVERISLLPHAATRRLAAICLSAGGEARYPPAFASRGWSGNKANRKANTSELWERVFARLKTMSVYALSVSLGIDRNSFKISDSFAPETVYVNI